MERKTFIRQLVIRGSAAVILPAAILQACESDDPADENPSPGSGSNDFTIDLDDPAYTALLEVGGSVYIDSKHIIVIHTDVDEYTVLSSVCTHQGCKVGYSPDNNNLPCPCHGSLYSISGSVLNGPATAPLTKYNATLDGSDLVIDI